MRPTSSFCSNEELYFELEDDQELSSQVILSNNGENNSVLFYSTKVSPILTNLDHVDNYGYAWSESNTDNEIDYNWIDIEDDNQIVVLPDNDNGGIINIDSAACVYTKFIITTLLIGYS